MVRNHQVSFIAAILVAFTIQVAAQSQTLRPGERTHRVAVGETLFGIAVAELGDGRLWTRIAERNGVTDPGRIQAGMTLVIPTIDAAPTASTPASDEGATTDEGDANRASEPQGSTESRREASSPAAVSPSDSSNVETPLAAIGVTVRPMPSFLEQALPGGDLTAGAVGVNSEAEALALARRENRSLRSLAAEIDRAKAGLTSARVSGRFNPEIEGAAGRRVVPPDEPDGATSRFNEWGVEVWQEFEIAGQRTLRMSAAELELERARAQAELEERGLLAAVRIAYIEAIAARDLAVLAQNREAIKVWIADAARLRYEAGDASRVEMNLSDADAARARADREAANLEYRAAVSRLANAIGIESGAVLVVRGPLGDPVQPDPARGARAFDERRDLRIALLDVRLADARGRLARAEGAPNLRLGVGYEREERATDVYSVRVGIPLPLFNPRQGDVEAAAAEGRGATDRVESLKRRIRNEVELATERLRSLERRRLGLRAAVEEGAEDRLRLIAEAYSEGKMGFAQLLMYTEQALESREAGLLARRDWNLAVVEFDQSIGGEITNGGNVR